MHQEGDVSRICASDNGTKRRQTPLLPLSEEVDAKQNKARNACVGIIHAWRLRKQRRAREKRKEGRKEGGKEGGKEQKTVYFTWRCRAQC